MDKNKNIFVTQPILPPLEECMPLIRQIWESKLLTNNGPLVQDFERALGQHLSSEHVSVVNNATNGLMIAQRALGFQGEVITTPFSFIATAHSIEWLGLKPVFVDIERDYGNINPKKVKKAINHKTGGILASHNFGFPADVEELSEIARNYNLPLVFDGAPAIGVRHKGKSITSYGDACILSFHATKIFTTLEGGAIISKTKETKDKINQIRNFNIRNEEEIGGPGINGKMNEIQAAIGLTGIKNIEHTIQLRKKRYQIYTDSLSELKNLVIPALKNDWKYNYSYYPIFFSQGNKMRETIFKDLKKKNIHCRKYWYPLISDHTCYSNESYDIPNAQKLSDSVLALPMGNDVSEKLIEFISKIIRKALNE